VLLTRFWRWIWIPEDPLFTRKDRLAFLASIACTVVFFSMRTLFQGSASPTLLSDFVTLSITLASIYIGNTDQIRRNNHYQSASEQLSLFTFAVFTIEQTLWFTLGCATDSVVLCSARTFAFFMLCIVLLQIVSQATKGRCRARKIFFSLYALFVGALLVAMYFAVAEAEFLRAHEHWIRVAMRWWMVSTIPAQAVQFWKNRSRGMKTGEGFSRKPSALMVITLPAWFLFYLIGETTDVGLMLLYALRVGIAVVMFVQANYCFHELRKENRRHVANA